MTNTQDSMPVPVKQMKIFDTDLKDCALVLGDPPGIGVENAVVAFVKHLKRATGVRLPVYHATTAPDTTLIVVGKTALDTPAVVEARAGLGAEGFTIRADGGRLYITGATERGTIYGLYTFLEKYVGCRFLATDTQVIHPAETVVIPADVAFSDAPYFDYRGLLWRDCLSDADQTNALRLNSTFRRDLSGHGGGMVYGGGFVHTLTHLAEMTDHTPGVQPCLTDETVYRTVLKNVRAVLEADPAVNIISVSQNDSYPDQGGCQCEKCRAIDEREGTPMGSLLTFVNRIAEDIKEDYPDVLIDTLAYRYTRKAPKTVKPADNVIIRLCSIECCFSHPIADSTCPDNVAFCKDIEEWSAICDRLYIWDYTTDFAYYLSPFPNFGVLWDNVRFFKAHHVMGMFEQGNYQSVSGEFDELRSYLLAHLLWNPDMSKEQYYDLMDEFLADYYGPGWTHIRRYIDRTTEKAAGRHLHIYDSPVDVVPPCNEEGQPDHTGLQQLVELWDAAQAEAVTEAQKAHVERCRMAAEYHYLCTCMSGAQNDRKQALLRTIRKYGLTHLHEGRVLPAQIDDTADPITW